MAPAWSGSSHAPLASLAFIALAGAMTLPGHATVAVYLVSYWHYYAYWLAFRHGQIALETFKRHAVLLKSVSLVALATAYFSVAVEAASLAIVALGFLLNSVAARALGSDRTYYGHEVAGLPHYRTSAFPYGWISHPMLVGNMAAFGGTLLNRDFRSDWWPLALTHVLLNLSLLLMETWVMPMRHSEIPSARRPTRFQTAYLAGGATAGAALGASGAATGHVLMGAFVGAAVATHAVVMHCFYTTPSGSTELGAQIGRRELYE